MTDETQGMPLPQEQPTVTPDLRLRAARPRVTRLSRKVLIGLGCISALAIAAALGYALQNRQGTGGQELYTTENRPAAEGLAELPHDYTGIPRQVPPLGPALPGDLGPPILHAQEQGQAAPGSDADAQRLAQEQQAALASGLFIQTTQQPGGATLASSVGATPGTTSAPAGMPPADPGAAQNMQDRKLAFIAGADTSGHGTISPDRLESPPSPYVVQAGAVIPAALITGIESDLPGQITAQVTENVYDSPTGRYLLIPQGARLIGEYDSSVAFGQSRVLLVWTRLIMPNGQSIVLERQEGADAQGYSGLQDGVDYHWWEIAKAAVLSTLLGVGTQVGASNNDSNIVQALREGAATSINQAGQQIVERQLDIQPTLTIRQGFPVRVIVDRDLVLAPYGQTVAP